MRLGTRKAIFQMTRICSIFRVGKSKISTHTANMSFLSDVHLTSSAVLNDHAITRFKFDLFGRILPKKKKRRHSKLDIEEKQAKKEAIHPNTLPFGPNTDSVEVDELNVSVKDHIVTTTGDTNEDFLQTVQENNVTKYSQNKRFSPTEEIIFKCDSEGTGQTKNIREILEGNETVRAVKDEGNNIEYDSDGDLQVARKGQISDSDDEINSFGIRIKDHEKSDQHHGKIMEISWNFVEEGHSLATELDAVGEQVWQGALLLCDFILHERSLFQGHCVVDLGAGTGLTSIVCAMLAEHVYCTDTGETVLKLAQSNVDSALDYFIYQQTLCPIEVRDLNWFRDLSKSPISQEPKSVFLLSEKDLESIKHAKLFIAADVIYDEDITEAFFSTVKYLMSYSPSKTLFIALERRLVFTIDDLDVSSPAYNYFRGHLNSLIESSSDSTSSVKFTVEQIDTDFPQYFYYNRTVYLELWKIRSTHALDNT